MKDPPVNAIRRRKQQNVIMLYNNAEMRLVRPEVHYLKWEIIILGFKVVLILTKHLGNNSYSVFVHADNEKPLTVERFCDYVKHP